MLKARKSLNFPTLPFFGAPLGVNPLEFCDEIWHQKTRIMGLPDGELLNRFDTIPPRDRQTDEHVALAKTRTSTA